MQTAESTTPVLCDDRAVAVVDGHLCQRGSHTVLEKLYPCQDREHEIADMLRHRAMERRHFRDPIGQCQDSPRDRLTLHTITVEQRRWCVLRCHERELPGQIGGILYARIHTLSTGGAMDMRRITSQENTSNSKLLDLAPRDMERGQPAGISECDVSQTTRRGQRLHLCQGRFIRMPDGIRRNVCYHPVSAATKGNEAENAIWMKKE